MFDTHAHLNFKAFDKDREEIIQKCLQENIWMINVGTNFFSSKLAVDIANKYEKGVYASVGLHPMNIKINEKFKIQPCLPAGRNAKLQFEVQNYNKEDTLEEKFDYKEYKKLAQDKKVVAIGEIGLDYYHKPKTKIRLEEFKNKQKEIFLKQAKLAQELNLPIIIHCRMAHQEMIEILKQNFINDKQKIKGVIHCFTGTYQQAKEYLKIGFLLGFNGIIFKLDLAQVIKEAPLEKILIETDCPYLSPPGYNQKRNDPTGVKYVAKKIARIKQIPLEEVADQTTENAQKLFLNVNY